MERVGIVVSTPTRIRLVDSAEDMSGDPHTVGLTSWTRASGRRSTDPITIQVLRGLPLAEFRHVIAHEFAHAAMVGSSGMTWLGPRVVEGFAEALALVHLRKISDPGAERVEAAVIRRPDPVYGDGVRLVLPAVEEYGLATVLLALQVNRPADVGLPRR